MVNLVIDLLSRTIINTLIIIIIITLLVDTEVLTPTNLMTATCKE